MWGAPFSGKTRPCRNFSVWSQLIPQLPVRREGLSIGGHWFITETETLTHTLPYWNIYLYSMAADKKWAHQILVSPNYICTRKFLLVLFPRGSMPREWDCFIPLLPVGANRMDHALKSPTASGGCHALRPQPEIAPPFGSLPLMFCFPLSRWVLPQVLP